jgi:hypothetical protein
MVRRGAIVTDLVVALIGFSLVFSAVFIAGRYFLPSTGLDIAAPLQPSPPDEPSDPEEGRGGSMEDLVAAIRVEVAAMEGSGGIVALSGLLEARAVLERVEDLNEQCIGCYPDEPSGVETNLGVTNMKLRYTGDGASLTLVVDFIEVGAPRSDGMTISIAIAGMQFSVKPGQCTLEILRSEHLVYPSSFGRFLIINSLAGELMCVGLEEIGGPLTTDLVAVFKLDLDA